MTSRYIKHITLNTGHSVQSPRAGVRDDIVNLLRPVLRNAIESHALTPLVYGALNVSLRATSGGAHAMITLFDDASGHPIITMTVATRSRGATGLWEMLHRDFAGMDTDPSVPPLAPWCGVVLLPALPLRPDALGWAGDLERCLAWAWMEERHGS
ncbi:hypothetical protein [Ancylobacter sp. IITR112]|uniref:hypothetical protein n=1 Tax=Ancylobacter sp. IITR112 TaxID=3138073 RepID=UPI00352AC1FD